MEEMARKKHDDHGQPNADSGEYICWSLKISDVTCEHPES